MPPDLEKERGLDQPVAGIDEAGRGAWAGPVVAAAVILYADRVPAGMDDSKKLSRRRREVLLDELASCAAIGVGEASPGEIDRFNILQASLLAMKRACAALPRQPAHALVDGDRTPALPCPATAVRQGDARCLSVAAASIVGKVARDRMMAALGATCPGYGWERNAGYGTAEHREALDRLGLTAHHRHSFRPVAMRARA